MVRAVQVDLATAAGVSPLCRALGDARVDALLANAGQGVGGAFLDQDFAAVQRLIDTNITGTLMLVQQLGRGMRSRGSRRILITGSIAGLTAGSFQAAYAASKAFLDSFAPALRNELKDDGVSLTCLMPGPTETPFYERAGMADSAVGQSKKYDPADVARAGSKAMMAGDEKSLPGLLNKVVGALAPLTPTRVVAELSRRASKPGDAGN